ncbi:synaptogyrin-2-like [Megalops cyprinoides]|uniref:synaptogyrin-2-like n=1 Tax=Megalops cyprinoides TaxID=118141 RepID=UPI00186495AC|nr:synaptogyrin-2-like [Megalops cyprinoides]
MEPGTASAYGASLAGGSFDFMTFIKQPHTMLRLLSWVCAVVVFACITAEGYINSSHSSELMCIFNGNDGVCHFAVGVGVLAFLACVAFLVLDAYFPQISNAKERKHIVMADLAFSGLWAGLWFVCFCLLANQWSLSQTNEALPASAARATIAFSFFSVPAWGLLAVFALRRYRQGVSDRSQSYPDGVHDHSTPDPSGTEAFQQPSFLPNPEPQGEGGYGPSGF